MVIINGECLPNCSQQNAGTTTEQIIGQTKEKENENPGSIYQGKKFPLERIAS